MKGVIFDMDDTLVDSARAHLMSIKDSLESKGIKMKWEEIRRRFGRKFEDIMREVYGFEEGKIRELKRLKVESFSKYLNLVTLMPGAIEVLKFAHSNFRTALVSMSPKKNMEEIVEHLKIKKYFDVIVSSEGLPSRPSPMFLIVASKRLKLNVRECISIGDSPYGAEAAHKVGIPFIGVTTGAFDRVDLERANADFITENLYEVKEILKMLLESKLL